MKKAIGAVVLIVVLAIGGFYVFSHRKAATKTKAAVDAVAQVLEKDSILKSVDGGFSFAPGLKVETAEKLGAVDILAIAFHPTIAGTMVVGSLEDGLLKKESTSENWNSIVFPPKKIYSFLLDKKDPDKKIFVSGIGDGYGKVFRTDDNGVAWRAVYTEPGTGTVVTALSQDPRNNNIIFSGTSGGTIVKSLDGGESWKNVGNAIDGTIKYISFDAVKPLTTYLLAYGKKMYYSLDGGETWLDWESTKQKELEALQKQVVELRKNGATIQVKQTQETITALQKKNTTEKAPSGIIVIFPDPQKSGVMYAGTSKGLFRSLDYGKYWKELNIIESAKKYPIRSISINPKNSNEIVFVSGKSFYKSTNFGDTWSVTSLGVTRDASFVVYDPFDTKQIFIGLSKISK